MLEWLAIGGIATMSGLLRTNHYRLEGAEVQVGCQCILREGQQHHLRAKTFQVLLFLLDHRERLVTKRELFENLWSDAAVSDATLVQCIIDLRKALADDARNPRYIKTVPKVGYQFIGAVTGVAVATASPVTNGPVEIEEYTRCEVEYEEVCDPAPVPALPAAGARRWVVPAVSAAAVLALVAAAAAIGVVPRAEVQLPKIAGKTRVAVLYFENQSRSERLDWLREGLADILISELSRARGLTLLSRHELHLLMQRSGLSSRRSFGLEEALLIAQKSHAEVVALGSFAELGDQVRVSLQLHDGASGRMLAAESLVAHAQSRILDDMSILSLRVARDLGSKPPERMADRGSGAMTRNLEAYRNYSLGVEKSEAYHNKEATALLEQAVALDPQFAMAYARLGYNYAVNWILPDQAKPHLRKAFALSDRLTDRDRLSIDAWYALANLDFPAAVERFRALKAAYPYDIESYVRLGMLLRGEERYDEAIEVLKQGLALDPDCKELYNTLGGIYSQQGRHEEAIAMQSRHLALAPHEANAYDSLGLAYLWAGRFGDAEKAYQQSRQIDPAFEIVIGHMGTLYAATGRHREAFEAYRTNGRSAPSDQQRGDAEVFQALLHWQRGEFTQAIERMTRASTMQSNRPSIRMLLALWRNDVATADSLSKQLLDREPYAHRGARPPTRRIDYYLLGKLALLQRDPERALRHFRESVSHWTGLAAPDRYDDCLANAYLELGRFAEAIAEYERVLRTFPRLARARYNLAVAYDRSSKSELARRELSEFLEIWKNADSDIAEIHLARQYRPGSLSQSMPW